MPSVMDYVLGLGANLGSRENNLQAALELLAGTRVCSVVACSHLYESDPVGPPQPRYLNAAARVRSALEPHAMLDAVLAVERALGRERKQRWGARTIDLDILWAEQRVASERLRVPHAHLHERWFARLPLLELAPELTAQFPTPPGERPWQQQGRRLHPLAIEPRARVERDELGLRVRGEGLDPADALAAACTGAGRALFPQAQMFADPHAPLSAAASAIPTASFALCADDPAGALLAELRARMRRGEALARVLIGEHTPRAMAVRMLQPAAAGTQLALAPRALELGGDPGAAWAELVCGAPDSLPNARARM